MIPGSWRKGPGEIESEVIMTRQLHAGSFLIVEGEDDHRFWRPRVTHRASGSRIQEKRNPCSRVLALSIAVFVTIARPLTPLWKTPIMAICRASACDLIHGQRVFQT